MKQVCGYSLEELWPIVAWLAECSDGGESTSITYEKAEQLMEAVMYCIKETRNKAGNLPETVRTAKEAYEIGYRLVKEKVYTALEEYNGMMLHFCAYKNLCLEDTFVKGIPEFFKWYDARFAPQETILTLDYPVPGVLYEKEGIDRIAEYIHAVSLEQKFLGEMKEEYVVKCLADYTSDYENMVENICAIVLESLVKEVFFAYGCGEEIKKERRKEWVEQVIRGIMERNNCKEKEMYEYLCGFSKDIAVRMWMSDK